jgi:prophage antirepressor-like protein
MSNLTTFTFPVTADRVRVINEKGEPWFHATDVCKVLGIANTTQAVRALHPDDKSMFNIGLPGKAPLFVNESGLFDLILNSRKPEAKAFRRWVTRDVLPAIRKDGAYIMGEEKVKTGEMSEDELILKAVTILTKKVERLTEERDSLQEQVTEHLEFMTVDE